MTYSQEDLKKLLLKRLVVFGYFETAADWNGDNDCIRTNHYMYGQVKLLIALCGESDFRKTPEAIAAYEEGVRRYKSQDQNDQLSYSAAYDLFYDAAYNTPL